MIHFLLWNLFSILRIVVMNRNEERRRTFALFPIDTKGSSRDKRRSREREREVIDQKRKNRKRRSLLSLLIMIPLLLLSLFSPSFSILRDPAGFHSGPIDLSSTKTGYKVLYPTTLSYSRKFFRVINIKRSFFLEFQSIILHSQPIKLSLFGVFPPHIQFCSLLSL